MKPRRNIWAIALISVGALFVAALVWRAVLPPPSVTVSSDSAPPAALDADPAPYGKVYITGEVQNPGVYEIYEGDRAENVVAAAGGFTENADAAAINLAAYVSDGQHINVYAKDGPGTATPTSPKINVNTADAATLTALPGIGPVTAQSIITYREKNGPFQSADDLINVPRIGENLLENIRDLVTTD